MVESVKSQKRMREIAKQVSGAIHMSPVGQMKANERRRKKRVELVGEKQVQRQDATSGLGDKNKTIATIRRVGEYKAAKKKK